MFFTINKVELRTYHDHNLENPQNPGRQMVVGLYRTMMRNVLFTVYSKKAFVEFWDNHTLQRIPNRLWSPQMIAFSTSKLAEAPKPPFIFKFTTVGWIFTLLVITTFGFLGYNSIKPPVAKSAKHIAMEKAPATGDILFGHYGLYKEKGTPIGAEIGYGWFKVINAQDGYYTLAKSTEMSKSYKAKEKLDDTNFEIISLPKVKLTEQTGYNIRFKSDDSLLEVYITDKK